VPVLTLKDGTAKPSWLNYDGNLGKLWGTPPSNNVRTWPLKFTVTDDLGATIFTLMDLVVTKNNHPIIRDKVQDIFIEFGDSFSLRIPEVNFIDPDGDTLSFIYDQADGSPLPAWINQPSNYWLYGTPAAADVREYDLRVRCTDTGGYFATSIFKVRMNRKPTIGVRIANENAYY
jgi:hypothetical protein